jgi:Ca2+-binding EF-hand superfamily protein
MLCVSECTKAHLISLVNMCMYRELGEPLSEEDVDSLLREITIDGDRRVNIRDLVSHMMVTSTS